ncbi:MAG: LLM class flavin-dependent oxidoreductase, partial [Myxococcales bacterium]|nr:LLM class flavin-dependent oxidoreductase [Myxococcales bacterium]
MTIGALGFTDGLSGDELVAFVKRLERQGYDSFWVAEIYGREVLSTCAYLLANTTRIKIATGIANVYARDAVAAENARRTLAEFSDGRFEMGLGVSHANLNEARGHAWMPPVRKLRSYLEAMKEAPADSPSPAQPAPVVLAAHGPKLMALAGELADGCLTYLSPPQRTELARKILGPNKTVRPLL